MSNVCRFITHQMRNQIVKPVNDTYTFLAYINVHLFSVNLKYYKN